MHDVSRTDGRDPGAPEVLDASLVRRWYRATLVAFEDHRSTVDALNVYPVPDGDTGSNLLATMRAACAELGAEDASLPDVTHRAARAAVLAARGNSGVILAQLLRGLADAWGTDTVDGPRLAAGLRRAADSAADAVAEPAAGTILSVAAAAADTAASLASAPLSEAVPEIARAAAEALSRTTDQLPALARAGVVDAGGLGLALMLDALAQTVVGAGDGAALRAAGAKARTARLSTAAEVVRETGSDEYAYEVQYLLEADPDAVERLRTILSGLGDSLVIVGAGSTDGGTPTWNVHVHVNDVGGAVEAGIEAGRPFRLSVTRFADGAAPTGGPDSPPSAKERGVVALVDCAGLVDVIEAEGAKAVLLTGGVDRAAIENALRTTGHTDVILLGRHGAGDVAEQAAKAVRADGFRVAVIPTRSPVQVLAALAVRRHERRFDDDVIAMAEAAGSCRVAKVTIAVREGLTSVGRCEPGDFLGHADEDVVLLGQDLDEVIAGVLDRLCAAGAELVTVVTGGGLSGSSVDRLREHLDTGWPLVEVEVLRGGQAKPLVWIGAE